ncbi:hypothetical protein [Frankia sp. Cr1]|nr:hypothetical protein [Frankia sp. Cr1]
MINSQTASTVRPAAATWRVRTLRRRLSALTVPAAVDAVDRLDEFLAA